jgi:hypothetical protein
MSIASFGHESQSFPERDTLFSGIEGHYTNPLERTFEQGQGDLAPDSSPTKSRAHVEAPHPQRTGTIGSMVMPPMAASTPAEYAVSRASPGLSKRIAPDAQSLARRSRNR